MPQNKQPMNWEKPKNDGRRTARQIDEEVSKLKLYPGRWSKVGIDVSGGWQRVYTQRGCEVSMKRTSKVRDRFTVWARWPKEGDTSKPSYEPK